MIDVPPKVKYSEFWEPIRREGLFKGKPVPVRDEAWISKKVRGILVELLLQNHKCFVQLSFSGENYGQPPINGWGQYAKTVIVPNKNEHRESSIQL